MIWLTLSLSGEAGLGHHRLSGIAGLGHHRLSAGLGHHWLSGIAGLGHHGLGSVAGLDHHGLGNIARLCHHRLSHRDSWLDVVSVVGMTVALGKSFLMIPLHDPEEVEAESSNNCCTENCLDDNGVPLWSWALAVDSLPGAFMIYVVTNLKHVPADRKDVGWKADENGEQPVGVVKLVPHLWLVVGLHHLNEHNERRDELQIQADSTHPDDGQEERVCDEYHVDEPPPAKASETRAGIAAATLDGCVKRRVCNWLHIY
jgi:hypothetical protein